jgi:hypothetical protein
MKTLEITGTSAIPARSLDVRGRQAARTLISGWQKERSPRRPLLIKIGQKTCKKDTLTSFSGPLWPHMRQPGVGSAIAEANLRLI